MEAQEWYYASPGDASPRGPLPLEMLRTKLFNGLLPPDARVWTDGMTAWEAVTARPEFAVISPETSDFTVTDPAPRPLGYQSAFTFVPQYAGFWLRAWAAIIDFIIISAALGLINAAFKAVIGMAIVYGASGQSQWLMLNSPAGLMSIIAKWLYTSLLESGPKQATLGKMALGILVVDEGGGRISFGRATGRHFAKYISAFVLGIGYLMAGWTAQKQALHDLIARSLVVRRRSI